MSVNSASILQTIHQLINRLERLSADSVWAHRASGMRGSLLRQADWLQALESPPSQSDLLRLEKLIRAASSILENAAREIPDPAQRRK